MYHDHIVLNQISTLNAVVKIITDIVNIGLCAFLINDISLWLRSWPRKKAPLV